MPRILHSLIVLILLPWSLRAQSLPPVDADALRQKPISTLPGPAGDLLKQWWKDGTAAGNIGDYYDNRDGDHSPLNLAPFPQLLAVKYSADDIKLKKHWAAPRVILSAVVFGNSSTSAPPTLGGSNPRSYYTHSRGLNFLAEQYAKNNIYIYPEHRDHDPGHNGKGDGYGDLYPTNTPYLIISQGSSGSDQPFMRAIPLTLAAFRPEVKKKLIETGALMPTLQWILRSTNKQLKGPEEYVTGKAHPSVFEGSWVDELAMVKLAHALELKALPPIVRLKVIEEDKALPGIEYFEDGLSEYLADTPAGIARIHRSKEQKRRFVVSAEESHDLNKAPLTFKWVVLRGDPGRIQIKPRNQDGSIVEITIAYHERRPIAPGSAMASNRVDIGVFVHNGVYHSAPGFVTLFSLDNEQRVYDEKGRVAEVCYGMGESELRVSDWRKLLSVLAADDAVAGLFDLKDARRMAIVDLANRFEKLARSLREAQEQVKAAEAREKDAPDKDLARKETQAMRNQASENQRKQNALLDDKQPALGASVRVFFDETCRRLARAPDLLDKRPELAKTYKPKQSTRIANNQALTVHGHLDMLVEYAFRGMAQVEYQVNYVDQRLTAARYWRDQYRYDEKNQLLGWNRHYPGQQITEEFNHEGLLVIERDAVGRCKKARTVRYTRQAVKGSPIGSTLRMELGDQFVTYEFTGPEDRRGKRVAIEPER